VPASLQIVGATAEGLQVATTKTQFQHTFVLEATNSTPVQNARVSVASFANGDSQPVAPTWKVDGKAGAQPFNLSGLGEVHLEVTADLPVSGTYVSAITLTYGGKRTSVPLKVTRTRPALPVEISGLDQVRGVGEDVELWMTVESKSAQSLKLYGPQVTELALVAEDKTRSQARFDRLEVRSENEQEPLTQPFTLEPGRDTRLKLTVLGLEDAGAYTGKVRLKADDHESSSKDLSLVVKKSGWTAVGLIFFGVLVSYLLRLYAVGTRPRIVRRRRLVSLLADLQEIADGLQGEPVEREQKLLTRLRRRLETLDEDLGLGTERKADDILSAFEAQLALLPDWINLGRRIDALEPPSLRKDLLAKLGTVTLVLEQALPTADETTAAATTLKQLENDIPAAVQKELQTRLDAFATQVQQPSVLLSAAGRQRLAAEVEPTLREAKDLAQDLGKLTAAQDKLLQARGAYARVLAQDLAANTAAATLPPGADANRWAVWQKDVQERVDRSLRETDPERAVELYEAVSAVFLTGLAQAWAENIDQRILVVQADPALGDDQKKDLAARLRGLADRMRNAAAQAEERRASEAAKGYAEAKKDLETLVAEQRQKGVQMGAPLAAGSAPEPPPDIPGTVAEGTIFPVLPIVEGERPTTRQLAWRLFLGDVAFTLVILVIAVLFGLQLLWSSKATWGGMDDYLIAVLWGLGLHTVSGSAFEGITALANRFRS
jgi:hypothetical protein